MFTLPGEAPGDGPAGNVSQTSASSQIWRSRVVSEFGVALSLQLNLSSQRLDSTTAKSGHYPQQPVAVTFKLRSLKLRTWLGVVTS